MPSKTVRVRRARKGETALLVNGAPLYWATVLPADAEQNQTGGFDREFTVRPMRPLVRRKALERRAAE